MHARVPDIGHVAREQRPGRAPVGTPTLECKLLDRRSFNSQAEARMAVTAFIEDF
jgi:hypothetical protein